MVDGVPGHVDSLSYGPFTKVLGRKYTAEKLSAIYEEVDVLKRLDNKSATGAAQFRSEVYM